MDTTLSKTSVSSKTEISSSNFETDIDHVHIDSKFRMFQLAENLRLGLSVLAFAAAITVMGISAHAVAVYDATHLPEDFLLPLWPAKFDLRPNEAMVAGSVVVIVANAVSLVVNKIKPIRNNPIANLIVLFAVPIVALIAAVVSMSIFYNVSASTTTDSFQSWTCRWKDVEMKMQPHFGTLCKQSQAGIALSVLLVPIEVIILGVAAYQVILKRQLDMTTYGHERKNESPALS